MPWLFCKIHLLMCFCHTWLSLLWCYMADALSSCPPLTLLIHDRIIISKSPVHPFTQLPTSSMTPSCPLHVACPMPHPRACLPAVHFWPHTAYLPAPCHFYHIRLPPGPLCMLLAPPHEPPWLSPFLHHRHPHGCPLHAHCPNISPWCVTSYASLTPPL